MYSYSFTDLTHPEPISLYVCAHFKPIDLFIFIIIDGEYSLYVNQAKVSFLDKINHIMSLHTIQNMVSLCILYSLLALTYDIYLSRTNLASSICSLVFCVFIFRVYLTLAKAATLILKHATLLRTSMSPKSALTNAELDYQKANVDATIQQHLTACHAEQTVAQFVGFIMSTDIGLLCLFCLLYHYLIILLVSSQSSAHAGA